MRVFEGVTVNLSLRLVNQGRFHLNYANKGIYVCIRVRGDKIVLWFYHFQEKNDLDSIKDSELIKINSIIFNLERKTVELNRKSQNIKIKYNVFFH